MSKPELNPEVDFDGFKWAGIIVGLAAGMYIMKRIFGNDGLTTKVAKQRVQNVTFPQHDQRKLSEDDHIIIAVDATPLKCAGLLRLPQHNKIYYYSVNWTSHYNFPQGPEAQEPDKFELTNAFLALTAFGNLVDDYIRKRTYVGGVILKTDNTFHKKGSYKDSDTDRLLSRTQKVLEDFDGKWKHVSRHTDLDMDNANRLSRYGQSTPEPTGYGGSGKWELFDISSEVKETNLDDIKWNVPSKYHTN